MKKKKVLFILGGFPPYKSPTDLAASFVIHEVAKTYDVICLVNRKYNERKKEKVNGITIYRINKCLLDRKKQKAEADGSRYLGVISILKTIVTRLNQVLTILIYPNFAPFYQFRLNWFAHKVCQKEYVDIIISVCFPAESTIAGSYVKQKMKDIKYIPYLIDAFSCGTLPKYLPAMYAKSRKIRYESKAISCADNIIAMEASESYYQNKTKYYGKMKFLNPAFFISKEHTGIDQTGLIEADCINIVYAGYLYLPDRNPKYLIERLAELKMKNICLIFVGSGDVGDIIEKAKQKFPGIIKRSSFIPHENIEGLLANADVLLNMGVSNSNAISGKIFEYMSYCKPILTSYFDDNDAAIHYLKQYPASFLLKQNDSTEENIEALRIFIENAKNTSINYESIEKIFYKSTPKAFTDILAQL